jgi:hypothetical protein
MHIAETATCYGHVLACTGAVHTAACQQQAASQSAGCAQIYYIWYGDWNTFSAGTKQFPSTFKVPDSTFRRHT